MKRALIIQTLIKQYRAPFFDALHTQCLAEGISLRVAYSEPSAKEALKNDNANLDQTYGVKVPAWQPFAGKLNVQCCWSEIWKADLIVVEQANRHLNNYLLLLLSLLGLKKVAFWGHGQNLQGRASSWREWLKRRLIRTPDWWFAYTEGTRNYLVNEGVSRNVITNVENSIDCAAFRSDVANISEADKTAMRTAFGIPEDAKVSLYCGAMYKEKRIDFLLESLTEIHDRYPDFHLVLIGGGPDQHKVEAFVKTHSWCHYAGPTFGRQKACLFALADFILNPGAVGLGIVDGFAAGLPTVTTDYEHHGREIDYLQHTHNGLISENTQPSFVAAVVSILTSSVLLAKLRQGARESSRHYSIENMANNFCSGITSALQ